MLKFLNPELKRAHSFCLQSAQGIKALIQPRAKKYGGIASSRRLKKPGAVFCGPTITTEAVTNSDVASEERESSQPPSEISSLHFSVSKNMAYEGKNVEHTSNLSKLPKNGEWSSFESLAFYQYQGFWYTRRIIDGVIKAQQLGPSELGISPSDVLLCSPPKSGTTWLKALAFSIVTRTRYDPNSGQGNPLLTTFPHNLIPYIESHKLRDPELPLLSTHMPYTALPESLRCKIVYIWRNPKDAFVSLWHFINKIGPNIKDPIPLEKAFDLFCRGISSYGPYWDHVLECWKASMDHPERILLLQYEDMMEDAGPHVRQLAEFMGYPFSEEEEKKGIPERIVDLCSFGSLSNLEVNKVDNFPTIGIGAGGIATISNSILFRKAKVEDWRNYLTDEMATKLDDIVREKFGKFGLNL